MGFTIRSRAMGWGPVFPSQAVAWVCRLRQYVVPACRWGWPGVMAMCVAPSWGQAQGEPVRRNWFNDPFFQVASASANCPVPLGPWITEAERDLQSHARAERGTTCWLAGTCSRPNAYLYDQDVAAAVRARLARQPALLAGTSLWITVRGRVVFADGCVPGPRSAEALDTALREVPDVAQVVVRVRSRVGQALPYVPAPATAGSAPAQ